ncbi:MAG: TrmH family RNA methyltransferase [Burkholderiales bacterium]|jgi:TrmH family RNA methyltransferase
MQIDRRITSRDNPLIRTCSELANSARERRRSGRSVIEGIHLVQAWLRRHGSPDELLVSDSACAHPEVQSLLALHVGRAVRVTDTVFQSLSGVQHGVGLLAVIRTPRPALPERWSGDLMVLDRVQDPGNVGAILRTCAAAGVGTLVTLEGSAFCWAPKVLRSGMGAHFELDIHESVAWPAVLERWGTQGPVLGTRIEQADTLFEADLRGPTLWLMGNEGEGLSESVRGSVTQWIRIPQTDKVESLNVGAAAAVCLFEQRRQRLVTAAS